MTPCLVPATSPLGQLPGGTNMVVIDGAAVGQIVLRGPGAGEGPTASAVLGDVIDLARGVRYPVFGQPAARLAVPVAAPAATPAPFYLRLQLHDRPGALARVATVLGAAGISVDRMRQQEKAGDHAAVLIVTHACTKAELDGALADLPATGVVAGTPVALRIESV